MKMRQISRVMLPVAVAVLFMASGAQAALTETGDVEPTSNPSTWTTSTTAYIGNTANGTLTVTGGSVVASNTSYLGNNSGISGTLNLSGSGSGWNISTVNHNGIYIGNNGTGTLNITNGAGLLCTGDPYTYLGNGATGTGNVVVNGSGSVFNPGGINSYLYDGYYGNGNISITNGGSSSPYLTYLAYYAGSNGSIEVDGAGSTLTAFKLGVGIYGNGKLMVTNGGVAQSTSNNSTYLGYYAGSTGTAIIDGIGSKFAIGEYSAQFFIGYSGTGIMSISDGGIVTAAGGISIDSSSLLSVDVGNNSSLSVASGKTVTNNGTIRLVAGADAANGTYTPITAGTWTGTGTIQTLGGVWNSTNQTVTVNSAITTTAGTVASMDLYTNQRGIVTDPSTGKSVGIGFQATTASNPITFSAKAIGGSELTSLQSLIGTGNSVLSAWSFTTTGTTVSSTNPVYLSLTAGAGQSLYSLSVYDFNGTSWSQLTPADLAYDGNYASFTALNLNDVAVVGAATPTPIPAAVWLLGSGLMGLVGIKRKKNLTAC
jgi:T5SS/PEP-CTERM-associated repeat protein